MFTPTPPGRRPSGMRHRRDDSPVAVRHRATDSQPHADVRALRVSRLPGNLRYQHIRRRATPRLRALGWPRAPPAPIEARATRAPPASRWVAGALAEHRGKPRAVGTRGVRGHANSCAFRLSSSARYRPEPRGLARPMRCSEGFRLSPMAPGRSGKHVRPADGWPIKRLNHR